MSHITVYHILLYQIKCAQYVIIGDLDLFRIPEAILTRELSNLIHAVVNVTFDKSYGSCYIHGFVIIPPTQRNFDME